MPAKGLQELLETLHRKFFAKLERVSKECEVPPAVILSEGVDLFRKRHRVINGPLGKVISDVDKLDIYTETQRALGRKTATNLTKAQLKKRASEGGKARAANLKKKKPSV